MNLLNKNGEEKEEKDKLLRMSEISLILDNYDDIFSDFDPRPYNQRALSYDFLEEAKRAVRDKPSGGIQLHFLIHKNSRILHHEPLIKRRLKEHFLKHKLEMENKAKGRKIRGGILALLGIIGIYVASYVISLQAHSALNNFLIVLLEPTGWFAAWTGLERLFYSKDDDRLNLEFYRKMARSEIIFTSY